MGKINDMIQRLCPDGVEYKRLGDVGIFYRGNGLQKKDFTSSGVGCIHYGQIYTHYKLFTDSTISFVTPELAKRLTKVHPGDLIITNTSENVEDVCMAVAWLGNEDIVTGGHASVFHHHENPKFLSYYFKTQDFFNQKIKYARGTKVIDVKVDDLAKIEIPIPPLEIQNVIVNVLDKFTALTAELEAELEARQKQYEYYRDNLLTFSKIANSGGVSSK
jgi:type I restriction enzyme S subunit